jgi:hypothetical protein
MFQVLLEFLERVIEQKDTNKMSLNNVAMIMAPNLFMAPKVRGSNPAKNKAVWDIEIKMAANTSNIMKMLIRYRGILWTVSYFIIETFREIIVTVKTYVIRLKEGITLTVHWKKNICILHVIVIGNYVKRSFY